MASGPYINGRAHSNNNYNNNQHDQALYGEYRIQMSYNNNIKEITLWSVFEKGEVNS
jgi:hypothetical protein